MGARSYWLDLFTGTTWQEFIESGAEISGFRENRWTTVKKIKPDDYLICYMTGISRFIGVLKVVSEPFIDTTPIWKDEVFPARMKVAIVNALTPETAVPVHEMRDELSFFQNMTSPIAWTGHFRGSPNKWKKTDAEVVLKAVENAKKNPVVRPVDPRKLARRPTALKAKMGPVTVPEKDEHQEETTTATPSPNAHLEIQWLLLKLGNDMGLDVWVARNDRSREFEGNLFAELPHVIDDLPIQFDTATNKTISLIDVLWLKGNTIVAAFEIESTTSIYSGLLRMSDLVAMQPNINIPLYIVAPDERRDKVFTEVNRPTFSRLSPKLNEICRYISFTSLKDQINQIASILRYLKPEFLDEISESCEIEEE